MVNYAEFYCCELYLFAAYIRKYIDLEKQNAHKHFMGAIISYSLVIVSNILLIYIGHVTGSDTIINHSEHFMLLNSPFILITSIELLIGFIKLKPHYNHIINKLASATLGVYLIHDNKMFRPYLWRTLLKTPEMYSNKFLAIHAVISIVAVYFLCSFIDLVRQNTVENIFLNIVSKHFEKMKNRINYIVKRGGNRVYSIVLWIYK